MQIPIIWPIFSHQENYETRYSTRFCATTTSRLTEQKIYYYPKSMTIGMLLTQFPEGTTDFFFLIRRPETIISQLSFDAMTEVIQDNTDAIVGPLFNETDYQHQKVEIPFQYVDLCSFLEVEASIKDKNSGLSVVDDLDQACIAIHRSSLAKLPPDILLGAVDVNFSGTRVVALNTLVHVFDETRFFPRPDLVELIPPHTESVLDVGCSSGGYGYSLKEKFPYISLTGIEPDPIHSQKAREYYDTIIPRKFEEITFSSTYDVINLGDVIEHLINPWETLGELAELLNPGGCITGSVPHIGHWSVVRTILDGTFEYIPLGLTCIGHLRFFSENTLSQIFQWNSLKPDLFYRERIPPGPAATLFIDKLLRQGCGTRERLLTYEFRFRLRKEQE